jgi:hypothetical protein
MAIDYAEYAARLGLKVVKDIIKPQEPNIPDERIEGGYQWITVHDTANTAVGANAAMHHRFIQNGGGPHAVSFTFAVDSAGAVQILALDQVNYAQGTATGNRTSISIEMCVNSDGDFEATVDNTAKLVAALRVAGGKNRAQVRQHNYWYGKDCPHSLRAVPGAWNAFMTTVDGYVEQLKPHNRYFPQTGYFLAGGFLDYWLDNGGMANIGYPLGPEVDAGAEWPYKLVGELDGYTVQLFERALLLWKPGEAVSEGRLGAVVEAMISNP